MASRIFAFCAPLGLLEGVANCAGRRGLGGASAARGVLCRRPLAWTAGHPSARSRGADAATWRKRTVVALAADQDDAARSALSVAHAADAAAEVATAAAADMAATADRMCASGRYVARRRREVAALAARAAAATAHHTSAQAVARGTASVDVAATAADAAVDALEEAAAVNTVAGLAARLDALRADAAVEAELKRLRDRLA
ncbi:hypothetical protein I4F81_000623 [Pyropia yezoensis]|uniref:Uncharacterized protein n=1 Tax=Pyropia yezoensis TaxID=2788 RepID=A0ACC3BJR7_PYRYE|nr:hypothetical protein I4F81_000623 [Neopyropia yezoensis]